MYIIENLYDAATSRRIDAACREQLNIEGFELMRRAAEFAFTTLLQHFSGIASVTVFCGKGNNAGDAYLVAHRAARMGLDVQLIALINPHELQGDAARAYQTFAQLGIPLEGPDSPVRGEVLIDGLLGTGLHGAPREGFAQMIDTINHQQRPVLSIDIPSGVNSDNGAAPGVAIQAEVTASFITHKIGLYTGAGRGLAGIVAFSDLGAPRLAYEPPVAVYRWWHDNILPPLEPDTYKHRRGHLLVIGGDHGMPGAVIMAASAAMRAGAGMVSVCTQSRHWGGLVQRLPEAMLVDDQQLDEALRRADLVCLGPGLGRGAWGEQLFARVMRSQLPVVLDADGLFWLAQQQHWSGGPLAITPHAAEAARLLQIEARAVNDDRCANALALAQRYGCIGVIKGPGTVMFGRQALAVCAHGNPGMASAGMGDVLAGLLSGLLLERFDDEMLFTAVTLHSAAADLAAEVVGMRSLLATDVIEYVPKLLLQAEYS